MEGYIPRTLERAVRRAAREFPAVVVTGPRQSGKTTLLRHLYPRRRYVSLEPPDTRAAAASDPRGFLELHPPPVILDEVQFAPELLPYVKEQIDGVRSRTGRYILSGSQNLLLLQRVTESLAGRAVILRLLPLSWREECRQPHRKLVWERRDRQRLEGFRTGRDLWEQLLRGSYPELIAHPARKTLMWHRSYVQTYLERDVRAVRQVGSLADFQSFVRLLAARSAQLLNLADLSRDLGVALNTVKAWLSVLEATNQILLLRPYFANIGKRLVKTPKAYFVDVGTLCHLVGLRDPEHAMLGPMAGQILETAVVAEVYKALAHRGEEPRLSFWRTSNGTQVDLLVEAAGKLIPVEVKLSTTPRPAMAKGIRALRAALGRRVQKGYVVHPGDQLAPLSEDATALPLGAL